MQAGIADGDGVSSAPTLQAGIADAPTPPPGNLGNPPDAAPHWFYSALQASLQASMTDCMHAVVIPLIDRSLHAALKRSRVEPAPYWTGGGPPAWSLNKKKNAGGG